ncbi:hypothetical protein Thivi_0149 [Thiocystis violascens DSM 198]|uniref:Uncharacterized protein n=1 Tax=Thiocystis violascens (strain ATCC 17096 / DSM 198 / 6111) TaxID=765911 RepID=I3Y5F7_THIV6|nr:hypothetical protein Thivi_0149 [Thiocystis violascens DSM 198]
MNAGAPLVFVSTFKLIDMLIEWVFEENKVTSTFRFDQKLKELKRSHVFPPFIESRIWLRERLAGFYSTLEPLRGTIIHDKHFTATDGGIRVASSKKGTIGPLVEISAYNLRKLAVAIVSILRYVDGTWRIDDFQEKALRYNLDELAALHGLPSLNQRPPFHTCVRVYLTGSDPLLADLMLMRSDLAAKYADQDLSFDLRVLIVKKGEVVDAYLFPWSVCGSQGTEWWSRIINIHEYKTAIPEDIQREHLRNLG